MSPPLVDLHGRHITYMRVSITDRCNLRCRYCMPDTGVEWVPHERIISFEELCRILGICVRRGVKKVRITGGEPLLRKGVVGFIEQVSAIAGLKDLSLTTNGILLESMAKDLKEAGLKRVNVSLDTLDRQKYAYITKVDAMESVIRGICAAHGQGLVPVKINVVAIRGFNDDEIPEFARLTVSLPVEVRFIELMPIGCIAKFPEHVALEADEIRHSIERVFGPMEHLEGGLGPARLYRIPNAQGTIGIIGSLSEKNFCRACNRIRITAMGRLRPCLFSDREIDLLTPMRSGISGEGLERLIEDGVRAKPPSHGVCRGLDLVQDVPRAKMSDIGG